MTRSETCAGCIVSWTICISLSPMIDITICPSQKRYDTIVDHSSLLFGLGDLGKALSSLKGNGSTSFEGKEQRGLTPRLSPTHLDVEAALSYTGEESVFRSARQRGV
jgi:hypothetical protein